MNVEESLIESLISDLLGKARGVRGNTDFPHKYNRKLDQIYELFEKNKISKKRMTDILLTLRDSDLNNNTTVSENIDDHMKLIICKE